MDNLFKLLRESKNGCRIGDYYAGVFGYADDLLLLCPSRGGLQNMLKIAEDYAKHHRISFSTDVNPSKSKTRVSSSPKDKQQTIQNLSFLMKPPCPGFVQGSIWETRCVVFKMVISKMLRRKEPNILNAIVS